jgi:hypothetical protein
LVLSQLSTATELMVIGRSSTTPREIPRSRRKTSSGDWAWALRADGRNARAKRGTILRRHLRLRGLGRAVGIERSSMSGYRGMVAVVVRLRL